MREAQKSRDNRAEIVRALSTGDVTRRDLFKMGIFTVTGALALKNGLSPFARSAYGAIPVGTPPSPLNGVQRFTQPFRRLDLQPKLPLTPKIVNGFREAAFPTGLNYANAKAKSWHEDYNAVKNAGVPNAQNPYVNPLTRRGPMEGRPPGPFFAHQRWDQFMPRAGYVISLAPVGPGARFHPGLEAQAPNAVWTYGRGITSSSALPPPLIKVRYGEPVVARIYNRLPTDRTQNGGFGRNETAVHNHNAHNGSGSDGAQNAHFFPGQFYDYHWGTCLARHDTINTDAADHRSWGIDDLGNATVPVPGDFRELQHTQWFHDHRFFFTAENVYKGNLGMLNYYGARDRGNEVTQDGINLRLPSGSRLPWGNVDFDVNLIVSDFALDPNGQLFFDIFDTDGFLGDNLMVNFAYSPSMNVLPRKYRFRILDACMARFIKLALVSADGRVAPVQVICNDGNLLVNTVTVGALDTQGVAERFDIVVDFAKFRVGEKLMLVNLMEHRDGRGPKRAVSIADALKGKSDDPAVGPVMQFVVSSSVPSVDEPGLTWTMANMNDRSQVPLVLTQQIPIVTPTRTRTLEFGRSGTPDKAASRIAATTVKASRGPSRSMGRRRITSTPTGFRWCSPGRGMSSTLRSRTAAAAGIIPSISTSRRVLPSPALPARWRRRKSWRAKTSGVSVRVLR